MVSDTTTESAVKVTAGEEEVMKESVLHSIENQRTHIINS